MFIMNKSNYPVLSRAHQAAVLKFLDIGANLALKSNGDDSRVLQNYIDYLKHLIEKSRCKVDPVAG